MCPAWEQWIRLMDAQSLFELTWIQPQTAKLKLIKYAHDL